MASEEVNELKLKVISLESEVSYWRKRANHLLQMIQKACSLLAEAQKPRGL